MNIDDIVTRLGLNALPNILKFVFVLMALVGLILVLRALLDMYKIAMDGTTELGKTTNSAVVRAIIGGFMMVPSVVLWRAAEALLGSSAITNTALLAYTSGAPITTTCDNMARLLILCFMVVGIVNIYNGLRRFDDAASGFEREGYRRGLIYIIGGFLCFYVGDIVEIIGNTIGLDVGLQNICASIG